MKTRNRWGVLVFVSILALAGCTQKSPEESAGKEATPAQAPATQAQPAQPQAPPQQTAKAQPSPAQASPSRPTPASPQAAAKPAPQGPAPVAPPRAAAPEPPKTETPRPAEPKPAPVIPSAPEKAVVTESKKVVPKDVLVLRGSPLGGVRFEHKLHGERVSQKCETCHHLSKPEKPATAPQQACSACHAKVAVLPMKTKYQAAFHNPMAQSGTCIDCHKAENATGKKAPVKCVDCHKKENT